MWILDEYVCISINADCGFLLMPDESTVNGLQQERLNARDFDVIKVIGRGAFGEVQLVSQ